MRTCSFIAVFVLLGLVAPVFSQAKREAPAPTHKDVKYGPHERNVLDFWQAESKGPAPVLVSIHDGGFYTGEKYVPLGLLKPCLDSGISVVAITFRYSSHAIAPAAFHDSARAIQFIRSKAKNWNIEPKRIASSGAYAGAGLSLWLGFHDDMADPKSDDPIRRESTRLTCMIGFDGQNVLRPPFHQETLPWKGREQALCPGQVVRRGPGQAG